VAQRNLPMRPETLPPDISRSGGKIGKRIQRLDQEQAYRQAIQRTRAELIAHAGYLAEGLHSYGTATFARGVDRMYAVNEPQRKKKQRDHIEDYIEDGITMLADELHTIGRTGVELILDEAAAPLYEARREPTWYEKLAGIDEY